MSFFSFLFGCPCDILDNVDVIGTDSQLSLLWSIVQELSKLCDIIVEPLRDRIVTSLLQATLVNLLSLVLMETYI